MAFTKPVSASGLCHWRLFFPFRGDIGALEVSSRAAEFLAPQQSSNGGDCRSLALNEQKIQGGIDPFLANVVPLRPIGSSDPISAVLPHDLDVAVYRSPLPSVTQRNECEVGKTPRSAIGHHPPALFPSLPRQVVGIDGETRRDESGRDGTLNNVSKITFAQLRLQLHH
jgi:hypothetical protein